MPASVLVIGMGNGLRGDDAAGLEIARRLAREPGIAVRTWEGEALALLELWQGAEAVIVVDAIRSGAPVATIRRIDASSTAGPLPGWTVSSHSIDLAAAIELARSLDRLPPVVLVYGIEGARFAVGAALSEEVAQALDALVDAVRREARALCASTDHRIR